MVASARDAKARAEVDLTTTLNSLAVVEEGGCRSAAELTRLEAERASLLLELEASKSDVSSLHARADKDREDMVKDYQGSPELIFSYGYGCCTFKNNICGDRPNIPNDMPNSPISSLSTQGAPRPQQPPRLKTRKQIKAGLSKTRRVVLWLGNRALALFFFGKLGKWCRLTINIYILYL